MKRPIARGLALAFFAWLATVFLACGSDGGDRLFPNDDASSGDDGSIFDGGPLDFADGAPTGCKPRTCADVGANCGKLADGCGGLVDCGTCQAPLACGVNKPNVCGTSCKALNCLELHADCGKQGDGCGNVIDCGACTLPATCGGGGPSTCGVNGGDAAACVKKTCQELGANCGPIADGCGGLLDCGSTCPGVQICGGGGTPNVCGGGITSCTPKTCGQLGYTCGPASDGCGNIIPTCGTCTTTGEFCGGGGPSKCGTGAADGGVTCVGLQCQQTTCPNAGTTSISGRVYDPAGRVGLPNVDVYVPNCAVQPFAAGASCSQCSTGITGCPLVSTTTNEHGDFRLTNMPVGSSVPVVIQIGRWRRQIQVGTTACGNTAVSTSLTHLPQNKSQGDIPLIALTTGGADPLECLLHKIGISNSEFTNPGGGGRVNFYTGYQTTGLPPATSSYTQQLGGATFPDATTLWNSASTLQQYDVTLLGCEGIATTANKSAAALAAMKSYADNGGRIFGSHFHYVWVQNGPSPWPGLVSWNGSLQDFANPTNETVLTGFTKSAQMNQWMQIWAGATSTTPSTFPVNEAKRSVLSINDTTNVSDWVEIPNGTACTPTVIGHNLVCTNPTPYSNVVQYLSYNTPVAATPSCGRFVFSDIHVASGDTPGRPFPSGCTTNSMTAQELALEFMFFDLDSPVCSGGAPPPPPTCTPLTCQQAGVQCGPAPDGCGGLLGCPPCPTGMTCGGGGVAGQCGTPTCTPQTCASLGVACGPAGDGCGGTLDCGPCPTPDAGACVPATCGGRCGPQGDGCGGVLSCPACDGGACVPTTCSAQNVQCGIIGDGCGNTIDCGTCSAPQTCGGGGTPYKCGGGIF